MKTGLLRRNHDSASWGSSSMQRASLCLLLSLLSSLILGNLLIESVSASPFPGLYANNQHHFFWYEKGLQRRFKRATNWNRANNLDPLNYLHTHSSNHNSSDVAVFSNPFTGSNASLAGYVYCDRTSTDFVSCNHFHMRYNEAMDTRERVLACHESGHTLGFDDYFWNGDGAPTTCTVQYYNHSKPPYFDNHDKEHINNYYQYT